MSSRRIRFSCLICLAVVAAALPAFAQPAATQPDASVRAAAATQPDAAAPADAVPLSAKVLDVTGSVVYRSASAGGDFKAVAKGMSLSADTVISAGPRSNAVITFGDNAVVVVEPFSVVTIAEVYRTTQADKPTVVTRVKVVNGSVRAGVERGRVQSDFQIRTPVATLSVRGTRPIRVFYDAGDAQLWFYLGSEGRIVGEVIGGGRSTTIEPGEGTNQYLVLPVVLAHFEQHVRLGDPWGQTMQEYIVEVLNTSGMGNFGGSSPQLGAPQIQNDLRIPDAPPSGDDVSPPGDDDAGDSFYGDDDAVVGDSFYD